MAEAPALRPGATLYLALALRPEDLADAPFLELRITGGAPERELLERRIDRDAARRASRELGFLLVGVPADELVAGTVRVRLVSASPTGSRALLDSTVRFAPPG
jgi:hypothetical protein